MNGRVDPLTLVGAEVERICDQARRTPGPGEPGGLRLWRPAGCVRAETFRVQVEPGLWCEPVTGPVRVQRFHSSIEHTAGPFDGSGVSPDTVQWRSSSVLHIDMHITAWCPQLQHQVTVSHRDTLLELALGVVRDGLVLSSDENNDGQPRSRGADVRWARQVAEVARFLPHAPAAAHRGYSNGPCVERERTVRARTVDGDSGTAVRARIAAALAAVDVEPLVIDTWSEAWTRSETDTARWVAWGERRPWEVSGPPLSEAEHAELAARRPYIDLPWLDAVRDVR